MRKMISVHLFACLLTFIALACTSKKEHHDHHDSGASADWQEMDAFHTVMAESFHPYKDSMNLQPAKEYASKLAESAEKWADAPLPAKVDNEQVKAQLQELKEQTATFARIAASGDDQVVGESLTKLHDLFHELQETWYAGAGERHEH